MRLLVKIVTLLAVLWCGWWWAASTLAERGVAAWMSAARDAGWQVRGDVTVAGFPAMFETQVMDLSVADLKGQKIAAQRLILRAPTYWPGDLTLHLPQTPVTLQTPEDQLFIKTTDGVAKMRLHPRPSLELERVELRGNAIAVGNKSGELFNANAFRVDLVQMPDNPQRYRFAVNAAELAPSDMIRRALSLVADWPERVETLHADMRVTFDAPLDRATLDHLRPQPRAIEIDQLSAQWGSIGLSANGAIEIEMDGTPTGEVRLLLRDWPQVLDLVATLGVLPPQMRGQAQMFLTALANQSGDADTLDLVLTFREGQAFLGTIPLGPAPRLILR